MKPLFTIHAGEYLVGERIEKNFKEWNVWIPSKDTGIDLLVLTKIIKNRYAAGKAIKRLQASSCRKLLS